MAGSGTDPQVRKIIPQHRLDGGEVEGNDGYYQSPPHHIHRLPRRFPWFPSGLRH